MSSSNKSSNTCKLPKYAKNKTIKNSCRSQKQWSKISKLFSRHCSDVFHAVFSKDLKHCYVPVYLFIFFYNPRTFSMFRYLENLFQSYQFEAVYDRDELCNSKISTWWRLKKKRFILISDKERWLKQSTTYSGKLVQNANKRQQTWTTLVEIY